MDEDFHGVKAVVFIGEQVLLYRRDSHVRWGNMWDMPGGGREGNETPEVCLARELHEEFGLDMSKADTLWRARFPGMVRPDVSAWFFVLQFPAKAASKIRFGSEGQYWRLFSVTDTLALPDLILPLRERFTLWLRRIGDTAE